MSNVNLCPILCETCGHLLPNMFHSKRCHQKHTFSCTLCPKSFSKSKYLLMHQKIHSESKFKCSICGQLLKSKVNLKTHHKHVHEFSNTYFYCHLCHCKYKQKFNLVKHMKKTFLQRFCLLNL